MKNKRQKESSVAEFDLSYEKKVTYEDSSFGPFVKIVKDYKSIGFNYRSWRRFRYHIPVMRKDDYRLDITPYKRVKNITYDGYTYIAFEQDWKTADGYWTTSYINLHLKEWDEFIRNLWKIDQKIPFGRAKRCFVCNDEQSTSDCHCQEYDCGLCYCNGCGKKR